MKYITNENFAYLWERITKLVKCNVGYECADDVVFNMDVRTDAQLDGYNSFEVGAFESLPKKLKIVFDDEEYICTRSAEWSYGASLESPASSMDWSEYPFVFFYDDGSWYLYTETAGMHSFKIYIIGIAVTSTDCFKTAVTNVSRYVVNVFEGGFKDQSFMDILDAVIDGRDVVARLVDEGFSIICKLVYVSTTELKFTSSFTMSVEGVSGVMVYTVTITSGDVVMSDSVFIASNN